MNRILSDIKQSFNQGRLAHAYLVSGDPRGEGKQLATRIVQLVFCEDPDRPCGQCATCARIAEQKHPDVSWLEPHSTGRQILAEEVRALTQQLSRTSYQGGWQAGIILAADRMNTNSANAFLKTLEEPPPQCLLLLVSDATHSLIPTIVSRCHRISLSSSEFQHRDAPWGDALRALLRKGAPASVIDALGLAADYASILDDTRSEIENIERERLVDVDDHEDVLKARVAARTKEIERDVFRAILMWHRDVVVCNVDPSSTLLQYDEDLDIIRSQAKQLNFRAACRNIEIVEHAMEQRNRNFRTSTVFEHMLVEFGRSNKSKN